MDTMTAAGELMFHIFGALAQFERSLIKERVSADIVTLQEIDSNPLGNLRSQAAAVSSLHC
jgi:hypothetical protein